MSASSLSKSANKNIPPEQTDMFLVSVGKGNRVRYSMYSTASERVQWVSREKASDGSPVSVRIPKETTTIYNRDGKLIVAGKTYHGMDHFLKSIVQLIRKDIRMVFLSQERFPCFDSYDYEHENRYFRWYFIREGNSISRVFAADERDDVYVTDDVANVDDRIWRQMQAVGFCQEPKD